jgi:hypothetical protein
LILSFGGRWGGSLLWLRHQFFWEKGDLGSVDDVQVGMSGVEGLKVVQDSVLNRRSDSFVEARTEAVRAKSTLLDDMVRMASRVSFGVKGMSRLAGRDEGV